MRLLIAAVGRLKDGGERVLVDRYLKRLTSAKALGLGPVTEKELVEARHTTVPERQADEAARLLKFADSAKKRPWSGDCTVFTAMKMSLNLAVAATLAIGWQLRLNSCSLIHSAFITCGK